MRLILLALWCVMLCGIGLAVLGLLARWAIYNRHDRLCDAWGDLARRNRELCGHPGPVEMEDFPGMADCQRDIQIFNRFWTVLMAVTGSAGFLLSLLTALGAGP